LKIGDARYHLEAVARGDEEGAVESALSELCEVDDISKTPLPVGMAHRR
jgi:hypothetical protein